MERYLWLFPVLFILHDFEEIIGFGIWGKKNMLNLEKRFPKIGPVFTKIYHPYSTEGIALAVFEELVLCIVMCILALYFDIYQLWIGGFIAFILHLFVHLVQAILWRGYIPAVATSVFVAPISIDILVQCIHIVDLSTAQIVFCGVIGMAIVALNLRFAHHLIKWFTKKLDLA